MTGMGAVSIVIPAFNEEALIRRSLEAAVGQTVPAREILVVDNGSSDATAQVVRQFQSAHPGHGVRLVRQDGASGIVPTRNRGFDEARGEVIGRFDADSLPSPDWVEQVEACFADGTVAAATGPVYYWDLPFRRLLLAADRLVRRAMLQAVPNEFRFLFGSNMALRASAWKLIRGETCPDEHDRLHEDIDLALHLAGRGLRIAYSPSMVTGISSRRLDDSPRDFVFYVTRFGRTYAAHGIHSKRLKAPTVFFLGIYLPARLVRGAYRRWSRSPSGEPPGSR
jgi:glycosyltransferase involved in cell wall biosynthesis